MTTFAKNGTIFGKSMAQTRVLLVIVVIVITVACSDACLDKLCSHKVFQAANSCWLLKMVTKSSADMHDEVLSPAQTLEIGTGETTYYTDLQSHMNWAAGHVQSAKSELHETKMESFTSGRGEATIQYHVTFLDQQNRRLFADMRLMYLVDTSVLPTESKFSVQWTFTSVLNSHRLGDDRMLQILTQPNDHLCIDVIRDCPEAFGPQELQFHLCLHFMNSQRSIDFDGILRTSGNSVMCRKLNFYEVYYNNSNKCLQMIMPLQQTPCVD